MDPTTIAALLTGLTSNGFVDVLSRVTQNALQAKKEYQQTKATKDLASPLEEQREELLGCLCRLQNDVILTPSNPTVLLRLLTVLMEQVTKLYEAKTKSELKHIDMSIGQIEGYLQKYRQAMEYRKQARWAAVIVSICALVALGVLIFFGSFDGNPSVKTILPVIQIPLPILIWSAIGSFAAILYRFNNSGDIELQDPLRWLFTRPLTGIIMGTITYLIVKAGILTISSSSSGVVESSELLWIIAFLSGFSDKFSDSLLKTLVGHFGGDTKGDIMTVNVPSTTLVPSGLPFLTGLPAFNNEQQRQKGTSFNESPVDKNQTTMQHPTSLTAPDAQERTVTNNGTDEAMHDDSTVN